MQSWRTKTEYELLRLMLDRGWRWEPCVTGNRVTRAMRALPNDYVRGAEKIWRTPGVRMNRNYLLCLLQAEEPGISVDSAFVYAAFPHQM